MADLPANVSVTGWLAADGGDGGVSTRDGGGGTLEALLLRLVPDLGCAGR